MHAFKYVQIDRFIREILTKAEVFEIISSRNYDFDIVEKYITDYMDKIAVHEVRQESDRVNIEKMIITIIKTSDHIFMDAKRKKEVAKELEQQKFLKSF
jgi:hypothetical protein